MPAGIENEQTIKLTVYSGEGINGGPQGDLYITFLVAKEIDLYTAVLGGETTVDTLSGKLSC